MIKKMKEVYMKNKLTNQNELIEEVERKRNLDDKKAQLRHEILKQIDDDEKHKSILEEELKKAEDQQKLLINKQMESDNSHKFYNKDFIAENNSILSVENSNNPDFIYKKSRLEYIQNYKDNSKKF